MLAELRKKSQITIPKELIVKLGLSEGDKLDVKNLITQEKKQLQNKLQFLAENPTLGHKKKLKEYPDLSVVYTRIII